MQLRIFKERSYATGVLRVTVVGFVLYGSMVLLPIFLQSLLGYPAVKAGIAMFEVEGSNTSTPNRCAPANAAANARFFTTDRVRVDGATWKETWRPVARSVHACQRWIRLAKA